LRISRPNTSAEESSEQKLSRTYVAQDKDK
jgi:hypothetical protein